VNKPLAFELKGIDPTHPMIAYRQISVETATKFGVGFFSGKGSMANRIVFPLYENSVLVGYAGRLVSEPTPDNPKWKLPAGLVKSFLYGLEKCEASKLLFVVESCWAVLFLHEKGLQAASLLGSSMSEAQERCLDPFGEIVVCMDDDDAGKEAAKRIVERLKPKHKVHKAHLKG
jgi:DNA primase